MAISLNSNYDATERHRAVIEHGNGLLVVVAGPGTGKTYSLLKKIESLLEAKTEPRRVYYLTFVNSIVDAFKEDIGKPKDQGGLGIDPDALGINISTLHSLAFKIVKSYADYLRVPAHVEVIELSPRSQSMLSQTFCADLFEYSKGNGVFQDKKTFTNSVNKLTDSWRTGASLDALLSELEKAVDKLCQKYAVCPWDQLVVLANKALADKGLPSWLQGAQHFLIDEYQDFNPAEQKLIKRISEPCDSMIIVGDPDQSIYSGRSASPKGLLDLLSDEEAKSVNFVHCRRCPKVVVTAANRLLVFMDPIGYSAKALQAFKDEDGVLLIEKLKSCKAEIERLVAVIKNTQTKGVKEILVLLPSKRASDFYVEQLCSAGIQCRTKASDASAELCNALLRLAVLRGQQFLERLVVTSFADVDRKYREQALAVLIAEDLSIDSALDRVCLEKKWQKRQKDSLECLKRVLEQMKSGDIESVMAGFAALGISIDRVVVETLLADTSVVSAREKVTEALKSIDSTKDDSATGAEAIDVMTMHSSKGLSKQLVILPAFEDKWLPGNNQGDRLAETHRLVYVALTRAKEQVLISYPKTRAKGDPLNYKVTSTRSGISRYSDILTQTAVLPVKQ